MRSPCSTNPRVRPPRTESLCRIGDSVGRAGDHRDVDTGVVRHRARLVVVGGARCVRASRCWSPAWCLGTGMTTSTWRRACWSRRCPCWPGRWRWVCRCRAVLNHLVRHRLRARRLWYCCSPWRPGAGRAERAELASFLAVMATAVTGAAVAYGYGWQHWVPAGAIAFGLIVITNAAKLTVAVAHIALPPIPAPGESVANEELLDPVATPDASDEETPTWQAIIASVPDSAARLSERSELAKKLLAGFLSAGALVLDDGCDCRCGAGAFLRSQHDRGRSGDGHVRVPLPAVCRSMVCLGAVGCGGRHPDGRDGEAVPVVSAKRVAGAERLCGAAMVALILVGATESVRRVSPVTKRILELLDGAADCRRHSDAAVDRQRVRHPAESPVLR